VTVRIGYLGLGAMGGALSAHLARAHDLTVIDRNPAAVAALVAKGAKAANSAAELARDCDIILLCLPRTSDVRDALFGSGGLAEGLALGKLVIDQTSGNPGQTAKIAADLAKLGVQMMDAPVSGGIPAAQAGKVTIIASGPDAVWLRAEPVLRAMADKVFRCSPRVGDGQALKLVNNAIGAGYRMATLELVALGRAAGLGLAPMVAALNTGPTANFTSRNMLVGLVEGRSTTNFALSLMVKDLNEALALGVATGSSMPMTAGARGLMQMGLHLLGKDAKLDDVIPLTERLAGVSLSGEQVAANKPLLAQIELAVVVCNLIAVAECLAMGRRFGLSGAEMARILAVGSAWSAVSDDILPAMAKGERPALRWTLKDAEKALSALSLQAATLGVPLVLPQMALAYIQDARTWLGEKANLGQITFGYELV
jgi:3-hydroxyisobutyrate dehydrogenase